jgi:hypothetical protein
MLSRPIVGGKRPDLRSELRGKLISGTGSKGMPLMLKEAPLAKPSLVSLLMSILLARKIQSGSQLGPGLI